MTEMTTAMTDDQTYIDYKLEAEEYEEFLKEQFEGWLESKQTPPDNM
jgi:hypothetical protein